MSRNKKGITKAEQQQRRVRTSLSPLPPWDDRNQLQARQQAHSVPGIKGTEGIAARQQCPSNGLN